MLSKNNPQIDMFTQEIFDKLVPKDHLLVKIDSIIDFSFVYDMLKDRYSSNMGRWSKDPVMMVKILLLQFLYRLSDPQVTSRNTTDIVFRWFLGLSIDDSAPDETTICHFRTTRMSEEKFDDFFNEIVKKCIEKDLIKTKRYLIDTTDVAANTSVPFVKKLIRAAYMKVIKQIEKFDEELAKFELEAFENDIQNEYTKGKKVSPKRHLEIAQKHIDHIYLKTYDELQNNKDYLENYGICYDIIDQYLHDKKDKIVSVVDPEARTANKSRSKVKTGYKDHIIIDEDSEIILASSQTPFNIGDEKKLEELVEKVEENFDLKPSEVTGDKIYGTTSNRAYLKDNNIVSNIGFYRESEKENKVYGLRDFTISEKLDFITCPNGVKTKTYSEHIADNVKDSYYMFKFDKKKCLGCPLREKCISKDKEGEFTMFYRRVQVPLRYDAVIKDSERIKTPEFQEAKNKRFKVERRFATMVKNHGLRRTRYIGLARTKIHIIMANTACNIIRMVNLLYSPSLVSPKI